MPLYFSYLTISHVNGGKELRYTPPPPTPDFLSRPPSLPPQLPSSVLPSLTPSLPPSLPPSSASVTDSAYSLAHSIPHPPLSPSLPCHSTETPFPRTPLHLSSAARGGAARAASRFPISAPAPPPPAPPPPLGSHLRAPVPRPGLGEELGRDISEGGGGGGQLSWEGKGGA